MDKTGYIYVIINNVNGKYYFGKTFCIKHRWNTHINNATKKINRKLYDAMNHYGFDKFSIHQIKMIIDTKENITKRLNELEMRFISFSMSNNSNFGYNMTNGGDGGDTFTNSLNKMEIIKKRKLSNTGKKRSKEICNKFSEIQKDIYSKLSDEEKSNRIKNIIDSRKRRIREYGYTEKEINAHKIFREKLIESNKSERGRLRVSKQFKGKKKKPFTEEHRKNIGNASKGRKIPGRKISIDNITYESLHEANRKLNIPLMTIRNRLINKNFSNYFYIE
jgi:group I intron endonuclease